MNRDEGVLPVKVYRAPERVSVAAPLPGLEPQDIRINVDHNGQLRIDSSVRGLLKADKEIIRDEWNPGPYHRVLDLPAPVDATMANATYENGVLVVSLPISSSLRPAAVQLSRVSPTSGKHAGNAGHPPRAIGQAAKPARAVAARPGLPPAADSADDVGR